MSFKIRIFRYILIVLICNNVKVSSNSEKNYGSFNLTITKFETCNGPKRKECATASASINGYSTLDYDILVTQDVSPTKGKITAMTNGKEFLRLQMKRPCDHLFMKPLFQMLLNVTKDCLIQKGHYNIKIDILKIAQTYYDGAFLFGNWTFKSIFYNDDCNVSCSIINVQMFPKEH